MSDRGRSRQRSVLLSEFYRRRFGSHSPTEYMNLRISGFRENLERDEIKSLLTKVFRDYQPFEIKVVRNPGDDERLAYVNFETDGVARHIRHNMGDQLKSCLGRHVICDPAGILRDQEGKYIPDRFNRALQGGDRTGRRSPDRRHRKEPQQWNLNQDDSEATRTLFVGNLPSDINEAEIRRVFESYGKIEDIDIKSVNNADAAFAFVMFQTIDQARLAKREEHERQIRPGSTYCKIGYGKSQVSRKIWIGGLGSWVNRDMLTSEFDRFGVIEKMEYHSGAEFAYIRFTNQNAAQDAVKAMKSLSLNGHRIFVDYTKDDTVPKDVGIRKRRASKSPPPRRSPHSQTQTQIIKTIEELDEEYASTWQGQMIIKKTECNVKLYRIAGAETLLQKQLRDEEGDPLKLIVSQRLALAGQQSLLEKIETTSQKHLSVMIAVGKKSDDDLKMLVRYLREKDAAGVISLPSAYVYIFPYSEAALKMLSIFSSQVRVLTPDCNYLLCVLANST
ncbi:hypothetical protein WR25_05903 [Diploscapter pachys]|uniref:Uncharacterized protein n=1 Tax=Diploscapter pachys TaxID=2018661 RepID=A0A2A2KF54_9BILA|nr:hypothetical protein WR25_05903 [Diploscapter pachys]